jgi:Asp-tRNA(Asn)/Glu-tRNA(Gln) amidotransferase A subunit family amidase
MSPLIPFTNPSVLLRGFTKNTGLSFKKYAQALERRDKRSLTPKAYRFIAQMQSFLTQWDAWICPVFLDIYPKSGIYPEVFCIIVGY